jgi:hypothetical protein
VTVHRRRQPAANETALDDITANAEAAL